jgi:hypothetical protein
MRLNHLLFPAALAIAALACGAANAQPATVEAGHTVLTLPTAMKAYSAPLARRFTTGDPIRIERQVVLLSSVRRVPVAALLIETTREAGAYIWGDSCKQLQNNAHTFVYSPFHAKANECTFAVGPLDLAAVIGESFADLGQTLRAGSQPLPEGVGFVIHSTYASAGGSMLSTTVFVRDPLARLSTPPETLPDGTGIPPPVVAWARALNEQVRGAMLSISGKWQLPPLNVTDVD